MPAVNPRITITLKPEVHAVLRRLSELTKNSQSAMVGELLEGALPMFHRMVGVLEAAHKLKAEGMKIPDELLAGLDAAQGKLEDQLGLALETFDAVGSPLLKEAERVQRRAGRGVPARGESRPVRSGATPLSNRGVTPHGKTLGKGKEAGHSKATKTLKSGGKNGQV